jgi:hypothetical protein
MTVLTTISGCSAGDDQPPPAASPAVRKLATLEVRTILPRHGAPMTSGAAEALRKLAASLPPN